MLDPITALLFPGVSGMSCSRIHNEIIENFSSRSRPAARSGYRKAAIPSGWVEAFSGALERGSSRICLERNNDARRLAMSVCDRGRGRRRASKFAGVGGERESILKGLGDKAKGLRFALLNRKG